MSKTMKIVVLEHDTTWAADAHVLTVSEEDFDRICEDEYHLRNFQGPSAVQLEKDKDQLGKALTDLVAVIDGQLDGQSRHSEPVVRMSMEMVSALHEARILVPSFEGGRTLRRARVSEGRGALEERSPQRWLRSSSARLARCQGMELAACVRTKRRATSPSVSRSYVVGQSEASYGPSGKKQVNDMPIAPPTNPCRHCKRHQAATSRGLCLKCGLLRAAGKLKTPEDIAVEAAQMAYKFAGSLVEELRANGQTKEADELLGVLTRMIQSWGLPLTDPQKLALESIVANTRDPDPWLNEPLTEAERAAADQVQLPPCSACGADRTGTGGAGISAPGEMNGGELELVLEVGCHSGSSYLSKEMWEELGKKAGWTTDVDRGVLAALADRLIQARSHLEATGRWQPTDSPMLMAAKDVVEALEDVVREAKDHG